MTKTQSKTTNFAKKVEKLSFEEASSRLEEVVEALSSQQVNLDSMVDLYQEGIALKDHCQKRLDEAKMKIETVSK